MNWHVTNRADRRAAAIADRQYYRQAFGRRQFTPPGRVMVLVTENYDALWYTSFSYPQYVKHAWAGAWLCALFRNESLYRSSDLIQQAVSATRWVWGTPPKLGLVTFVDPAKIQSRNPGYCFKCAGFRHVGATKSGLVVLQLLAPDMPPAAPAHGTQLPLFGYEEREVQV